MADHHDRPTSHDRDDRWFRLVHTPGPALDDGASIFAHPAFAEHLAFLGRLDQQGWLVAAGPTDPQRGEGMTIVRIPAGVDADIEELARIDDACVRDGYLAVEVCPWLVAMTGG